MKRTFLIPLFCLGIVSLLIIGRRNDLEKTDDTEYFDHPEEFAKYEQLIRTRANKEEPNYAYNHKIKELLKIRPAHHDARFRSSYNFKERGPANVPGRTRAVLALPSDSIQKTWLAATVGGGIWKTDDAGISWSNTTADLPNLSTTSLTYSASNPNIIYAGTGEYFAGRIGINGSGIYKSINQGETWMVLASTMEDPRFGNINRIIADPRSSDTLMAAVSSGLGNADGDNRSHGIFKSVDGGKNWVQTYESDNSIDQIKYDPKNPEIVYGSRRHMSMIKSTDGGNTWKELAFKYETFGRMEFDISPVNTDWIYASSESPNGGQQSSLLCSRDAGMTWGLVRRIRNRYNPFTFNYLGRQGYYDNTIMCHPFDHRKVYFGGVDLWTAEVKNERGINLVVDNTEVFSFLRLVNLDGRFNYGSIGQGNVVDSLIPRIEIRFGPGQSQKAHRFVVNGLGARVPPEGYFYQNYSKVPFEVWDIDKNRQLMVSFRDQQENGIFDLIQLNTHSLETSEHSREYLYIHDIDYSDSPNKKIARTGGRNKGHEHKLFWRIWPVLEYGQEWSTDLPKTELRIRPIIGPDVDAKITSIADAYARNGGPNRFRQQDKQVLPVGIHPDHHSLNAFNGDSVSGEFQIINSNDGGVYVSNLSTNPGTQEGDWSFVGSGLRSSQFYDADKRPGVMEFIGGMQDNGTWKSPSAEDPNGITMYNRMLGGDGFEVAWNKNNPSLILGTIQFNRIRRTVDGGKTWRFSESQIESGRNGPFYSKLDISSSDPNTVFGVGKSGVWKSIDFGNNWTLNKINSNFWADGYGIHSAYDIEVSDADGSIVWAGGGMSDRDKMFISTDGGATFDTTGFYHGETLGPISGIASHPTDRNTAYLFFSFAQGPKVLRTTDLGKTWEDISGFEGRATSDRGFPDVAVRSLYVFENDPDKIWVGTEIGLLETITGGREWHYVNSNLPSTAIFNIKKVDDVLVFATHGRGIWTFEEEKDLPKIKRSYTAINGKAIIDINIPRSYDSLFLHDIDHGRLRTLQHVDSGALQFSMDFHVDTTLNLQLVAYTNGILYSSNVSRLSHRYTDPVIMSKVDDLSNEKDYYQTGINIEPSNNFSNLAAHSSHPLINGSGLQEIYLRAPIIVDDDSAVVSFDEILLTGSEGSLVGSKMHIQGSKNGYEWKDLVKPYTSVARSEWSFARNSREEGTEELFIERSFNIYPTFSHGDTIFLKWCLSSGLATNQWGWVMDNLTIQNSFILSSKVPEDTKTYIFPSPASHFLRINLATAERRDVYELRLIDAMGRVNFNKVVIPFDLIKVSTVPRGFYLAQLLDGKKLIHSQRILLE